MHRSEFDRDPYGRAGRADGFERAGRPHPGLPAQPQRPTTG